MIVLQQECGVVPIMRPDQWERIRHVLLPPIGIPIMDMDVLAKEKGKSWERFSR